jgi:hypothetical protein
VTDKRHDVNAVGTEKTLLRLELSDRPGSLAVVASVFGACRVNILRLEVVGRGDGVAVDDLLIEGGDLERALRELGALARVLTREPRAELPDPGVAMAEACAAIADAPTLELARGELLRAAIELARANEGVLLCGTGHGWLQPVAATVERLGPIRSEEPTLARKALADGDCLSTPPGHAWAPPAYLDHLGDGAAAIVPSDSLVLVVVRAGNVSFAQAELLRLQALARVTRGVLAALGERWTPLPTAEASA